MRRHRAKRVTGKRALAGWAIVVYLFLYVPILLVVALVLFGLAGGELVRAGCSAGLRVANEVFADRTYQPDGTLTPRNQPHAIIHDLPVALGQVEQMVRNGTVFALDGSEVAVEPDTICIHGDEPGAAIFARELRALLNRLGIAVRAPE